MQLTTEMIRNKLIINKSSKKCFIFDLDGTIIFNNQQLSNENDNILHAIVEAGHEVAFATGRSYRDFKDVMPKYWHDSQATLFSGSVSFARNGNLCQNIPLPKENAQQIVEICFDNKYPFIMDNISHYYHPPFQHKVWGIISESVYDYKITDLKHMLTTDIYKILILDMLPYKMFDQYAVDNNLVTKHHSYDKCFDILVKGCNKYDGLLPLIGHYNLEDVFIFGNDFNDYEMLLNFPNSILFGGIPELKKISKINIPYNIVQQSKFILLINSILAK
jgi:HAD superfamily hydrolase (TIGR01484 family)